MHQHIGVICNLKVACATTHDNRTWQSIVPLDASSGGASNRVVNMRCFAVVQIQLDFPLLFLSPLLDNRVGPTKIKSCLPILFLF